MMAAVVQPRRSPRAHISAAAVEDDRPIGAPSLFRVRAREIWAVWWRQSPAFWLICLYIFLEYVRPQEIYPVLRGLRIPFWTMVICTGAFFVEGARLRKWTLADSLLVVFSFIVLISSVTAYYPSYSFDWLSLYFSWVLVYFLITNIVNTRARFFIFMLLYMLFCVKMTQHGVRGWVASGFGFRSWGVTCAPSWFRNSGECGVQMAMLFPISLYFLLALRVYWPRWKSWGFAVILPAASVITIVASSSRGAVLALGALALLAVSRSRRKFKAIVGVALLLGAVYVLLPPEQKERFREIGEDDTSLTRKQYFWDGIEIMNNHPTLGIGYKNWLPYYGQHYGGYQVPHNIFIEAGAELGYAGLLGFIALIAATFVLNARTRRMAANLPDYGVFNAAMANAFDAALVAFAVAGYFVTILYYPFFWINLAMTVALYSVTRTGLWESSRASTGGNAFQAHGARVSRARSGTLPRHSTGHGT